MLKQINFNPLHTLFKEQLAEAFTHDKIVVCSQRPLNGDITFEYENIGYGRYFAVGNMDQYLSNWQFLDAAIVNLTTNEYIEEYVKAEVIKEGADLQELLQEFTYSELAEQFNLVYID